jgi:pyruvate dehydrogenase (quinone)
VLGAGVAKALLGRAAVPDDLPFVTGAIGLLGTKPSWTLMDECDTLLVVGSSFPYSEFLPPPGQARGVQIDIKPEMLAIRYPMEVALVGDARATLRELLPLLHRKDDRGWRERIEREVAEWRELIEQRARQDADPLNPQLLFQELNRVLPANAILAADSGSGTNWFARNLRLGRGHKASVSGTLASMGCAVPYAIAAKFAYPDRPAIAFVGDGAMQMNGMAELITAAKYYPRWSDPRLAVLVLNNGDLKTQRIPEVDYARFAELVGLRGIRIESPDEVEGAWDVALSADRPCVIDAVCDPNVPPIPPHVEPGQATSLLAALRKGDPEARGIVRQTFKEKLLELLPGRD